MDEAPGEGQSSIPSTRTTIHGTLQCTTSDSLDSSLLALTSSNPLDQVVGVDARALGAAGSSQPRWTRVVPGQKLPDSVPWCCYPSTLSD
jgi:hypothetical protein